MSEGYQEYYLSAYNLSTVNIEPSFIITGFVRLNLKTKEIEYLDGYTPDKAAKDFWEAWSFHSPKPNT